MKLTVRLTLLLFVCFLNQIKAENDEKQHISQEYLKLMENIAEIKCLSYSGTFNYYNDFQQSQPNEVEKMSFGMNGHEYYWMVGNQEIQKSTKYVLIADHDQKVIMIDKSTMTTINGQTTANQLIDSLLKQIDSVRKIDLQSSEQSFRIFSTAEGIAYADVVYNSSTNWFDEIQVYFTENRNNNEDRFLIRNKLKITYSNVTNNEKEISSLISINRFLEDQNGSFHLKDEYQSYEFLNHLTPTEND